MKTIEVASLDPAFAHFGVANLLLDLDSLTFTVQKLTTIVTAPAKKETRKVVRKNSDNLTRCKIIVDAYPPLVRQARIVFSEVPHGGAKSASACWGFGAATMAIAICPVPVIQVQPSETKMATVGTMTASKEEMIEWAAEKYPDAPWQRYPRDITKHGKIIRAKGAVCDSEEHVADAIAVAEAGIRTDQFLQLLPFWRTAAAA